MSADLHSFSQCASWDNFSIAVRGSKGKEYIVTHGKSTEPYTYGFHCTCPAFKFSNPPQECKHIKAAKGNACLLHEQHDGGNWSGGVCPRCGGPITAVMCAV